MNIKRNKETGWAKIFAPDLVKAKTLPGR